MSGGPIDCTDKTPCEVCSDILLGRYSPGDDCLGRFVPNDDDRQAWAEIKSAAGSLPLPHAP